MSPKKKNNQKYNNYILMTLLAFKPFKDRDEFLSRTEQELEKKFDDFRKSDICPNFVRKNYHKANKTKQKNITILIEENSTGQDEILEAQNETSSDSETDDESDEQSNGHEVLQTIPQIGKFTEAYQEYGHMAPKGLEYEGQILVTMMMTKM